jgi:preprotein translocase subunit SecY
MLRAFVNAFKIPDLRKKILFTLFVIAIYRVGSYLPVPNVDIDLLAAQTQNPQQGFLSVINLFSGGALTRFAVFALGIMPYITSSIIMQLLSVVIPKLEQWRQQGEVGQKKITQWTRYMTVTLALLQSTGLIFLFNNQFSDPTTGQSVVVEFTPARVAFMVITLTAGTALIMWLGELITQRGIGNGMSILIFTSVISELPSQGYAIFRTSPAAFSVIVALGILIILAVVFMEQGQRRIPVQYAKRVVGRRMTQGGSTYIPLKVNQSGVIPIIFASSVLYFPSLLAPVIPWDAFRRFVNTQLATQTSVAYILIYFALIVFFAYFYTAITFNPVDTADNIRKYGGFIPGIRPGRPTAEHLDHILTRITLPGSLFLASIAIIPSIAFFFLNVNPNQFPFGGTSILIVVGVALETMKQLESQLTMRHYEGFLR